MRARVVVAKIILQLFDITGLTNITNHLYIRGRYCHADFLILGKQVHFGHMLTSVSRSTKRPLPPRQVSSADSHQLKTFAKWFLQEP